VIIADEGDPESVATKITDLFRNNSTLLLITLSLESRNIYVHESYQLNNPGIERVIDLVRDFGRNNLRKEVENGMTINVPGNNSRGDASTSLWRSIGS
jgi:hypothetical protein